MKLFFFVFFFFIFATHSFAQQLQIQFETNYNHHIRNIKIPHDIVCKVQNKKDKIRGSFYNFKSDTIFLREYFTNDTFKICWNNIEWMRIKRNAVGSIAYDSWMIGSWAFTGISAIYILEAYAAQPGSEGAGYVFAAGLGLFVISFPQAIISTAHRFKKYNPHEYQIRMK